MHITINKNDNKINHINKVKYYLLKIIIIIIIINYERTRITAI